MIGNVVNHIEAEIGYPGEVQGERPLLDTLQTSEHKDSLSVKTELKRRSVKLSKRIEKFDDKRGVRMGSCGHYFTASTTSCEHRQTSVRSSFRCMDRLCPSCARKRSAQLTKKLSEPLKQLQEEHTLSVSFVTLTYNNVSTLPDFKTFSRDRKRLMKSKFWNPYGLFGSIGTVEATVSEKYDNWHPHMHLVVFTENPIPLIQAGEHAGEWEVSVNQSLSEAWERANGYNGDIVKGKAFDGNYQEVLKYILKDADNMDDAHLQEFAMWSKGKRFLFTGGKIYANKELKQLIAQAEAEEEDHEGIQPCSECGCTHFEVADFAWMPKLHNYVILENSIRYAELDEGVLRFDPG